MKSSPSKSQIQISSLDCDTDDQDPTIQQGYVNIYEAEMLFKIHLIDHTNDSDDFPNQEHLKVRVLVLGENKNLSQIRIELSSENDLFFHFIHSLDAVSYQKIKEEQKLNCKFIDYPAVVVKNFDQCVIGSNQ